MALYTIRTNLSLEADVSRGDNIASMSHHFEWVSDEAAVADFPELVDKFTQGAVGDKWTCARGDALHEQILYRRDITNPRSFSRIAQQTFTLADYTLDSIGVEIEGVTLTFDVVETPVYRHRRGAVLVTQRGEDRSVTKRTYVGPLSPMYYRASLTLLLEVPAMFGAPGPGGDFAPYENDRVDLWRDEIARIAVEHCSDLQSDFEHGQLRLVSWDRGIITPLWESRASLVRADLLTRSLKSEFTPWLPRIGPWPDE